MKVKIRGISSVTNYGERVLENNTIVKSTDPSCTQNLKSLSKHFYVTWDIVYGRNLGIT